MAARRLALLLVFAVLSGAPLASAEEVEVVADSAKVKVGNESVASVRRGDRLPVLRREGAWVAVVVKTAQGDRKGWILATQVRTFVDPSITENSPAPAAPRVVELAVDWTQVWLGEGGMGYGPADRPGRSALLYFEMSITNQGMKTLRLDPAQLVLKVDGKAMKPAPRVDVRSGQGYPHGLQTSESTAYSSQTPLKYLAAGDVPPGGRAVGWLAFETPVFQQVSELAARTWILSGNVGDEAVEFDLREAEFKAVGAKVRPASIDPSVPVLEIGSRINGLNVEKLVEAMQSMIAKRQAHVVLFTAKKCVIDGSSRGVLEERMMRGGAAAVWAEVPAMVRERGMYYGGREAASEAIAAIQVLAGQPETGAALAKHLTNPSAEIRAGAASGLAGHTAEKGVVDALVRAVSDDSGSVRAAALRTLGGQAGFFGPVMPDFESRGPGFAVQTGRAPTAPPEVRAPVLEVALKAASDPDLAVRSAAVSVLARSADPKATAKILGAAGDTAPQVRASAAAAAASHPAEAVAETLIRMLGDKDYQVVARACGSLGKLNVQAAVPRLKELQAGKSPGVAPVAIDALKALGALSELEAALAKLDVGQFSPAELEVLSKAKEKRAVPKLLEAMPIQRNSYLAGPIAKVLGELGDRAAVEPLVNLLRYADYPNEEIPRALGKLGDPKAIEPLKAALKRPSGSSSHRFVILEALLALKAPGVFDQVAAELKQKPDGYEAGQLVRILGKVDGKQAIPVIEPLLDSPGASQNAAAALVEIGTPEALAPIKARLLRPDHPHVYQWISQWASPRSSSGQPLTGEALLGRMRAVASLLREAAKSTNPNTRSVAASQLPNVERILVEEELKEFGRLVSERRLDAADATLQAILARQLEALEADPRLTSNLRRLVSAAFGAYARVGEMKRAEEHLAKILDALKSKAKGMARTELDGVLLHVRAERLMGLARARSALEPKEVRQLLDDCKHQLAEKAEEGLVQPDIEMLVSLARTLEDNDFEELAAEAYRAAARLVASSPDRQASKAFQHLSANVLEGAARRLALVGKPFELKGTMLDGRELNWASYRSKLVLVDFWISGNPACWAQIANSKKLYNLYHDRGFDVVGINLDQDRQQWSRFLEREKLPWASLSSEGAAFDHPLAAQYGVSSVPTTLLVDKEGKVASLQVRGHRLEVLLQKMIGPPYQPSGRLKCLELRPRANRDPGEMDAGDPGNHLKELPQGEQTLGGVKFTVGPRLLQLGGLRLPDAPRKISGIGVGSKVTRLYMLQATQFGGEHQGIRPGTQIGQYQVHYEDGTEASIPVATGEDVRDWWIDDLGQPTSRGIVVWTGSNDAAKKAGLALRLYLGAWNNLHPDKKIDTLDFVSTNTVAAPFCVAITAEEPGTASKAEAKAEPER